MYKNTQILHSGCINSKIRLKQKLVWENSEHQQWLRKGLLKCVISFKPLYKNASAKNINVESNYCTYHRQTDKSKIEMTNIYWMLVKPHSLALQVKTTGNYTNAVLSNICVHWALCASVLRHILSEHHHSGFKLWGLQRWIIRGVLHCTDLEEKGRKSIIVRAQVKYHFEPGLRFSWLETVTLARMYWSRVWAVRDCLDSRFIAWWK